MDLDEEGRDLARISQRVFLANGDKRRLIFGKNTGLLSRPVPALPLALDRRLTLEWVGAID